MKKLFFIGMAVFAGLIASCNKEDELCEDEKLATAFLFDYPDTVETGIPFYLTFSYVIENSCGEFGYFDAVRSGNTLDVKLKTYYKGCNCTDGFIEHEATYPIIFEESGNYILKLWVTETEYESYLVYAAD